MFKMIFLNAVTILFINLSLMIAVRSTDTEQNRQNSHPENIDYSALFRKFIGNKQFLIPDEHFQFRNRPDGRRMKGIQFPGFFDSSPVPVDDSGEMFLKEDITRGLGSLPQLDRYDSSEWNSLPGLNGEDIACVQRMRGTSCRSNADCHGCDTPFICSWVGICNDAFPYRKRTVKQTRKPTKNILWSRMKPRSV